LFTGVSGSGKSSLVFGTIAARSTLTGEHLAAYVGTR
jgi:excinuclease UvrABC ATPase subunit